MMVTQDRVETVSPLKNVLCSIRQCVLSLETFVKNKALFLEYMEKVSSMANMLRIIRQRMLSVEILDKMERV